MEQQMDGVWTNILYSDPRNFCPHGISDKKIEATGMLPTALKFKFSGIKRSLIIVLFSTVIRFLVYCMCRYLSDQETLSLLSYTGVPRNDWWILKLDLKK